MLCPENFISHPRSPKILGKEILATEMLVRRPRPFGRTKQAHLPPPQAVIPKFRPGTRSVRPSFKASFHSGVCATILLY
jgi:hypothetical protein